MVTSVQNLKKEALALWNNEAFGMAVAGSKMYGSFKAIEQITRCPDYSPIVISALLIFTIISAAQIAINFHNLIEKDIKRMEKDRVQEIVKNLNTPLNNI